VRGGERHAEKIYGGYFGHIHPASEAEPISKSNYSNWRLREQKSFAFAYDAAANARWHKEGEKNSGVTPARTPAAKPEVLHSAIRLSLRWADEEKCIPSRS
jgi:predicted RNase H-like nuclease